jgi:predicted secreted acid phosphatase
MKLNAFLALLLSVSLNTAYADFIGASMPHHPDITSSTLVTAEKEPLNIAHAKKQAKLFHDSGQYEKEINIVATEAVQYLESRLKHPNFNGKKPAIVLDIDETALSNYKDMVTLDFGGTEDEILQYENHGADPAIQPILHIYRFAKTHNIAVFFITGRFEEQRKASEANLKAVGYESWDGLVLRSGEHRHEPAAVYKTAVRKHIEEQGYDILLTIGDQYSDLRGGYADKAFKLPNPFYLIP